MIDHEFGVWIILGNEKGLGEEGRGIRDQQEGKGSEQVWISPKKRKIFPKFRKQTITFSHYLMAEINGFCADCLF